ncbi:MAG: M81 family metallopeptidase [Gemmataceae bacterium]|nr:M81 family metallopeptidase [Gemmataceae bacterium]
MPRILIAGLFHETHTFVDSVTRWGDFHVVRGDAMLQRSGDSSPLGGALQRGAEVGWTWLPTLDCRATPSGTVERAVWERYWSELQRQISEAGPCDAVFLVLHGAMVTDACDDVEGELLERLRSLPSLAHIPVVGVFDLHAHFSARMANHADALVAYRENPHSDARDAAIRAVDVLHQCLSRGVRCRQRCRHAGIIWPPTGTASADEPMRGLEAMARRLESEHPNFLAVNVVAGFAFGDAADTGVSFAISTLGPDDEADAALSELADFANRHRQLGNIVEPPVDEVMARLQPMLSGLTVIAEPSDNIGGGAPGDGTGLLRAFIQHSVRNAAVCLCDPTAVGSLSSHAINSSVRLSLGGRGSRFDQGPIELDVTLVSRSDGRFELQDKRSHLASLAGDFFDMGPTAVVRHAGILILLTSKPTPPMDLGQWTSQAIDPTKLSLIGVKAAVAHRGAFAPIAAKMLSAGTPGPCTSELRQLPFRRVRRPVFPLD